MHLLVLSIFVLFVCVTAIIYPFPPFKTRKRAMVLSAITFVVSFTASVIHDNDPGVIAKRSEMASNAIAEAEKAIEAGDLKAAKVVFDNLDYRAADLKHEAISKVKAKITRIETLPILEELASDSSIRPSDKILRLQKLWKGLGKPKAAKTLMAEDFEQHVLPLVKAIPASQFQQNKSGYELLAKISSFSEMPNPSYAEKAKSYGEKISQAESAERGCSPPNYGFTSQVPPLLKNPSSFKAIRVYMGPKDGQGYQAAYMDYYATNGFGGTIQQTAQGKVRLDGCKFTLITP